MKITRRGRPTVEEPEDSRGASVRLSRCRATIAEVAREAGVSVATVSRVVNRASPYIALATRHRVEAAIESLHYTPNRLVRSLQQGCTKVIAYTSTYPGLFRRDEFEILLLTEICRAARTTGYDILVLAGSVQEDGVPGEASILDGRCDGVILQAPRGASVVEALAERRFPTLVLGNRYVPQGIGSLQGDNIGGTRKAMEYLLSLGHRRIAHLCGPVRSWDEASCRMGGYLEALEHAGIPRDASLIMPNGGTATWEADAKEVETALNVWLEMQHPPTAVFCASDRLAATLLEAARRRGLHVPRDLSVIGFDDMPIARYCNPPLTTVSIDLEQLGSAAVDTLQELIARTQESSGDSNEEMIGKAVSQIVSAKLVIRGSTAPSSNSR